MLIDGVEYLTKVMPDGREWMLENLRSNTDSGCGGYYMWDEAVAIASNVDGWHLPTYLEWDKLITACGDRVVYNDPSLYDGKVELSKKPSYFISDSNLKATTGWKQANHPNANRTDLYGFGVKGCGEGTSKEYMDAAEKVYGEFRLITYRTSEFGWFWTGDQSGSNAYAKSFYYDTQAVSDVEAPKNRRYSVRLIKDN